MTGTEAITAKKLIGMLYPPVSSMSGIALFIIAGSRFSYAIVAVCSLFWVFLLGTFANAMLRGVSSKTGRKLLNVMFASSAGSLYYLFLYLLNPLLAMETVLICALSPVFFMASGLSAAPENPHEEETIKKAARYPLSLGIVTLVFSLLREPLGFATLSVPGGKRGIIELFNSAGQYPYAVQLVSSSTGALFLLAYLMVALRYMANSDSRLRP
ncbi:MAG: hypothetical protein LBH50_05490 [Spirochaetaceae bacterium]|jgi:hypothetical protein|nr:hypothetical protein [Spirochaetaceae bacterium]